MHATKKYKRRRNIAEDAILQVSGIFLELEGGRRYSWQNHRHLWVDWPKNEGASTSHNLLHDSFTGFLSITHVSDKSIY
jgi:hypothetical protein